MRNPNYPKRKIRHSAVMRRAGFKISKGWMELNSTKQPKIPMNVGKLIYWTNPQGVLITVFDYQQISMAEVVKRVYLWVEKETKNKAHISWKNV